MLCQGCGFTNSNDSSFCSMCGETVTPTVGRQATLGTVPCPSCSFLNEDISIYCRACGQPISAKVGVPAMVGSGTGSYDFISLLESPESMRSSVLDKVDEKSVSTRHESLLARLDRMELDISSRLGEKLPVLEPEVEPVTWNAKEDNLTSLSSTLDELLADLIDAEINEYLTPDFIHPDETGFPAPVPAIEEKKSRKHERRTRIVDALVIIALIVAVFLVGMTVGLWGSYSLGF